MPFPKLSAVLNNCPLHALTPEIKSEIIKFGADEHYKNNYAANYVQLKNDFAAFYGLESKNFSWEHFATLLKNYNEFDTQIILGPVLRSFMKKSMAENEDVPLLAMVEDISTEEYINSKTEINPRTGRYESLSPDELFTFVSKHLGFGLTYHPQGEPSVTCELPAAISIIDIYHQGGIDGAQAGGHWERTNKGEASINVQNQDDTQLNTLIQLLGDNPVVNPYGFTQLKQHVQVTAANPEPNVESAQQIAELNIAAIQILKYISNVNSVPKDLAVSLLGKSISHMTELFIDEYEFEEVPANQIFERWIRTDEGKKPALNEIEQRLINGLIAEVPQSSKPSESEKDSSKGEHAAAEKERLQREDERLALELAAHEEQRQQQENELRAAQEENERLQLESELLAQELHAQEVAAQEAQKRQQQENELRAAQEENERLQLESELLAQELQAQELVAPNDPAVKISKLLSKTEAQSEFEQLLISLKEKVDDLAKRCNKNRNNSERYESLQNAWVAADTLHIELDKAGQTYFNHPTPRAYQAFEQNCDKLFQEAHVELDKHRDWSEFLINLAIGVFTIGAGLLIKGLINYAGDKSFFHVHQTKSNGLLNDLQEDLKKTVPPIL